MTDDDNIAALFRAAAADTAPPPAFGHDDVVVASNRITARRTMMVRGALGVLVLVGIGGGIAIPMATSQDSATTASAPYAGDAGAPGSAQDGSPYAYGPPPAERDATGGAPAEAAPVVPAPGAGQDPAPGQGQAGQAGEPLAGGSGQSDDAQPESKAPEEQPDGQPAPDEPRIASGGAQPLGPGTSECADRQDPALRSIVEEALPEVRGAPEAATTMECRPRGERGVNLEVADSGATGVLSVVYLPPGAPGGHDPDGGVVARRETTSRGTVTVSVRPGRPGARAPFDNRVDAVAEYLAPRL
ncbi:hypothetical protein [Pseudonocardia sp. TRM90224]|uniref:hypothetical protein n=1 Tax=Pseudonocardia sp. TRM90224 TaxID=2812678 RepID=UPI001E2E8064|nr:hypothetical protein [Pseudonocardia sp. TRM90224]